MQISPHNGFVVLGETHGKTNHLVMNREEVCSSGMKISRKNGRS